jgi:peptide subunit release factor 1 (eRF1)
MTLDTMNLQQQIKKLAECKPSRTPFISLYLNTRGGTATNRRQYDIFLEDKLRFFEKEFSISARAEKAFKKSWEQIAQYLNEKLEIRSNGAALFSRWLPDDNFFLALQFPVPLENRFVVDGVPHIFPLVQFLHNLHHYMLMISDSEITKIFEIQFGGIKDIQRIHKPEDERGFRGEWSQMHYQNCKKNQTERLIKNKIEILANLMQRKGVVHLILAGDEVMVARTKQELPEWLVECLVDFNGMEARTDDHQILRQTLTTFAEFERSEDMEAVSILHRELLTDGLAVIDTPKTVQALNKGIIDRLIVAAEYEGPQGWRCEKCDFLRTTSTTKRCQQCGLCRFVKVELKEEMILKGLLSGSSVETIIHHDAWLIRQGGVGALLRHN